MVGSKQRASYLSGCLWTTVTWPAVSQSASALRCVATGDDFYGNCDGIVTTTTATTTLRQRRRERKQQQQQLSSQQQQQQLILLHWGELKADSTMALAASFNVSYYFKETSRLFTIYCYFLIMLSIGKNRLNQRMTSRGVGHAHGWVFSGPGSTWPVQTPWDTTRPVVYMTLLTQLDPQDLAIMLTRLSPTRPRPAGWPDPTQGRLDQWPTLASRSERELYYSGVRKVAIFDQ